jgi:exonuclease SbcC
MNTQEQHREASQGAVLRYIIHAADIHIGKGINMNRTEEFKAVFIAFSDKVKKYDPSETIILLAGDIFDRKDILSANEIDLFDYLIGLLHQYKILIIPGNHDCIVLNPTKMDLLTPLVKHHKNIIYLRDTCIFKYLNEIFLHISVYDQIDTEGIIQLRNKCESNPILLYHGVMSGAVFGAHVENASRITNDVYSGCKLTLAGDIHQRQFIKPNVAYCGSLLQHDVSEGRDKGFLVWDLKARSSDTIILHNDYGQYKIDLSTTSIDDISKIEKKKYVHKVNITVDGSAQTDEKINAIRAHFGRIDNISKITKGCVAIDSGLTSENMLRKLLENDHATFDDIEYIVNMHKSTITTTPVRKWYIKSLRFDNLYKYGEGNFIDFTKFNGNTCGVIADNQSGKSSIMDIIVYGLFNVLLRGGIKGRINDYAKNSFIKIEFVSNGREYVISRSDYMNTCKNHSLLVKLDKLDKSDNSNSSEYENITEKSVTLTYDKLKTIIGSMDEFLSTAMYYDNSYDIIKMNSIQRRTILGKLFGMYEKKTLLGAIKDHIKQLENKLNSVSKPATPYVDLINNQIKIIDEIKVLNNELSNDNLYAEKIKNMLDCVKRIPTHDIEKTKSGIEKIKDMLNKIDDSMHSLKNEIQETVVDAPVATGDEKLLAEKVIAGVRDSVSIRNELNVLKAQKSQLDNVIAFKNKLSAQLGAEKQSLEVAQKNIPNEYLCANIKSLSTEAGELKAKLVTFKLKEIISTKQLEAKINLLRANYTYNSDCECCQNTKKLLQGTLYDAELEYDSITKQNVESSAYNDKVKSEISIIKSRIESIAAICKLLSGVESIKSNITKIEKNMSELTIVEIKDNQNELTEELKIATESEAACKQLRAIYLYKQSLLNKKLVELSNYKSQLENKLNDLEYDISVLSKYSIHELNEGKEKLYLVENSIREKYRLIGTLENKLDSLRSDIKLYEEYNRVAPDILLELKRYEMYKKCIDVRGLVTLVVKENMKSIIDRVNEILNIITNFNVVYDTSDDSVSFGVIERVEGALDAPKIALEGTPTGGPVGPIKPLEVAPKQFVHDIDTSSGFQKFIVSLVLRLVLTSALPSSSEFMFIDEGFGCMDKYNIEKLNDLFCLIKTQYKFIFIISHLYDIQSVIDFPMYIKPNHSNIKQSHINNTNIIQPKEKLYTQGEELILCECGLSVKKKSMTGHLKTKKHTAGIELLGVKK